MNVFAVPPYDRLPWEDLKGRQKPRTPSDEWKPRDMQCSLRSSVKQYMIRRRKYIGKTGSFHSKFRNVISRMKIYGIIISTVIISANSFQHSKPEF